MGMPYTRAFHLRLALKMALGRVRLGWRKLGLSEEERFRVADETINELRRTGGWRDLDQELEVKHPGPSWMDGKPPKTP